MAPPEPSPTTQSRSLIGFDYGLKWIGVAIGQTVTASARALPVLKAKDGIPQWHQIEQLLKEWQPDTVIVGLPLNMDDSESELSARARKFANRLHGRFNVPVELHDERLSSFEARGEIMDQHHSKDFKARDVDSMSAVIILESYMRDLQN